MMEREHGQNGIAHRVFPFSKNMDRIGKIWIEWYLESMEKLGLQR